MLNWNMFEDRRNEVIQEDDQAPTCSLPTDNQTPVRSLQSTGEEDMEVSCSSSAPFSEQGEELPGTSSSSSDATSTSASLALTVVPVSKSGHVWKSLIGEFDIRSVWIPSDCEQRAFTLHRIGDPLCLTFSSQDEDSGLELRPVDETFTVECSLNRIPLEDLDWLQKRRVVQLCHQAKEESVKACMIIDY